MTGHAVHPANLNLLSALKPAVCLTRPASATGRGLYQPRALTARGGSSIVGPALVGVTVKPERKVTADSRPTRPYLYFALKQTMSEVALSCAPLILFITVERRLM